MILRIFHWKLLLFVYIAFIVKNKFCLADQDGWVLEADSIINPKANPVLANGHIGFTVFDTSVYMNGLYNGKGPQTHRARIENHANLQMEICSARQRSGARNCRYRLNLRTGIFETIYSTKDYTVKHEVFPHRHFTRTIVNRFVVERKASKDNIVVPIITDPGNIGLDMTFPEISNFATGKYNVTLESGTTLEVENEQFQKKTLPLTLAYTKLTKLNLTLGQNKLEEYAFMIVDPEEAVVRREMAKALFDKQLVEKHIREWTKFWDSFDIEVDSRIDLVSKVRASLFYLVSNFQSNNAFESPRPFYGVSSSGLGDVNEDNQLQGRITWDQEMFMQPVAVLINPEWSEQLLNYRYMVHSNDPLSDGWNYFWESGYTGAHLDVYREMIKSSHVPADVAFAARVHLSATHDKNWLKREGCELAYYTAKYWATRTEYNSSSDLYDLPGVRPSVSFEDPITNNAFVNVAVGYNLYLGEFASCMCKGIVPNRSGPKSNWNEIARSLTLPYDDKEEFVLEHSGYEEYIRTSAADIPLLIYPLQFPLNEKVKRNSLEHYKKAQIKTTPPTTWAMHIIGDLELENVKEEDTLFLDITYYYMERPFHVWTDRVTTVNQVYNFVSGAAAYIQVFMNGYAGIRIFFDRMEIRKPKLPPHTTRIKVKGFMYLSAKFDVIVTTDNFNLILRELPKDKIELIATTDDGRTYALQKIGDSINTGRNSTITVKEKSNPYGECQMPDNIIGVPRKTVALSEQTSKSGLSRFMIFFLTLTLIAAISALIYVLYKRYGSMLPSSSVRYVRTV